MVSVYCIVTCAGLTTNFSFSLIINAQVTIQMGLFLQLLQIVLISTQLLKEATTTTTTNATATATTTMITTTIMNTASSADTGTTTVPLVQNNLTSISTSNKSQPKSVSQSTPSTDLHSTQSKASNYITGVPNRTQFINSSYRTSSMIFTNSGSAALLVTPTTTEQTSSHVLSQPKSVSQSTPSADLNSTQSKASSYITGVPNRTQFINSSYGTSSMIFINSGSATLLVTPTTTEQTSSPSVNDTTPTPQVSPSSSVLYKLSSSQSGNTTRSASTTLNSTTTTQGFSASSMWKISSDNQTSPLSTPKAMNTTSSVDAGTSPFRSPTIMNTASSADTGTTTVPLVKNNLTSISTSNKSQPKNVSQSTPSTDLHSTQSKASSYITGVPNRTLSINSSYGTSPMILTNSGSATTQAVYFTSNHPTKESSSLLVAHTTTDSFTKLTSAISGINFSRQETVLTLIKPCQMLIIKHRLVCLTLTTDGAPFALYVEEGYCGGGGYALYA